jgi:uncharacterized protein (TIRG00374 family)
VPLFIKVLGSDQRDADLLYRAYRFIRLRDIGDTRPAASLTQAVEHQALAAVMAERAGVAVPAVRQVIKTADGSALLAMERVDGSSLDRIPVQGISDMMLRELWKQAQVGSSWRAILSADWAWLPLVIALSAATYPASAVALMGAVLPRIRFWPTVLAQGASSFVNRVSPANVGGMALNARYLQKSGVEASAGVAAVGVNSVAGAIVHLVLLVVFFAWSGRGLARAFKLPSSSKLLLILAVVVAIVGIVLATRPGRRFAAGTLIPGLRSAAASLRRVAQNPAKMIMLFGGSVLITLAYIGGLAASVQAFGGGPGIILIGAVYLGAAAIAAAAPSPGGLGAIEAALVAGLIGAGMQAGPAVSAVLLYRLATYWLPVAPGWLCWRALLRREYV